MTNTTHYYICGGAETKWTAINATTVRGAKRIAAAMYTMPCHGARIVIGELVGHGDNERIDHVAAYHDDHWATL